MVVGLLLYDTGSEASSSAHLYQLCLFVTKVSKAWIFFGTRHQQHMKASATMLFSPCLLWKTGHQVVVSSCLWFFHGLFSLSSFMSAATFIWSTVLFFALYCFSLMFEMCWKLRSHGRWLSQIFYVYIRSKINECCYTIYDFCCFFFLLIGSNEDRRLLMKREKQFRLDQSW